MGWLGAGWKVVLVGRDGWLVFGPRVGDCVLVWRVTAGVGVAVVGRQPVVGVPFWLLHFDVSSSGGRVRGEAFP